MKKIIMLATAVLMMLLFITGCTETKQEEEIKPSSTPTATVQRSEEPTGTVMPELVPDDEKENEEKDEPEKTAEQSKTMTSEKPAEPSK